VKVTVMLEELLALGHAGAEYDAWLIRIQRRRAVRQRLRRRQPQLQDPGAAGPQRAGAGARVRVRRHPAVPGREVRRLPAHRAGARAECLSWLFWQMGSAPYLGGGFGHFYAYAPSKIEYAIDRFAMEVKRQLDVLDRRLAESTSTWPGDDYTIADIAVWPWYGALAKGQLYEAGEFLQVQDYTHVQRWTDADRQRPAVQRGRMVNRTWGEPASQLHERHDASDFDAAGRGLPRHQPAMHRARAAHRRRRGADRQRRHHRLCGGAFPEPPLLGVTPAEKAEIASWNWRVEFEGLLAIAEALRNSSPAMANRALPGPVDYPQIPNWPQRGLARVQQFFATLNARLAGRDFVATDRFSVADITAVVAVDFARVVKVKPGDEHPHLQRWRAAMAQRPAIGVS
jgi:GST-like protein